MEEERAKRLDQTSIPVRSSLPRQATITDVAALAGVSRGAVSKVFNGTGRISEPTAERIRLAAAKLNWRPSVTAAALRRSRTQAVGLVLTRPGEFEIGATSSLLIAGIESVLAPREYSLLLHLVDPDNDHDDERRAYERLAHLGRVDGVILSDSRVNDPRFKLMQTLGLPAVLIGTPWNDGQVPFLDNDPPGAGVDDSVAHLIELGHKRIGYIGGPEDRVQAVVRRSTFVDAMAAATLAPVAVVATRYSPGTAAEETVRLLSLANPPTAIVFGSDTMAIGGIHAARSRGVDVPGQLSVVGFDGLPIGAWMDPALTTVERDVVQRGRAVAARLLELLGQSVESFEIKRPHLVVRGSTAPLS